ncbi:hypothetical protein [Thalassospira aquimaris]|uniref:Uncharacterized protein n=1 Tax=Thalassospira aquimaris TaxID=3037796 RepID=A0ABT6GHP8_9PROT|nr:hypothetical protein [Thalassospira sp. FZY0004]MDG4721154.1 hypothetical protein [Thalassospira sp. FZY0004]
MSQTFEKLYLVAPLESDLITALSTSHALEGGGTISQNRFHDGENWITLEPEWCIQPIGPIREADPETGEVTLVDGRFHMNIKCTPELATWITAKLPEGMVVDPVTPLHTWSD